MDRHNGHARRHNDRPRNIPHLHPPFVGEKGNAAPAQKRRASDVLRELWSVLREFFTKRHIRVYILFIILYRFGEGFVVKIVPLFLKARSREAGGLGLDTQRRSGFTTAPSARRRSRRLTAGGLLHLCTRTQKTLFPLVCIFNIPFAVYVFLAWLQPTAGWMIAGGIVLEYFGYGFGFVGLTLLSDAAGGSGKAPDGPLRLRFRHHVNLGVMIPGMLSGWLSEKLGYTDFFIFVMAATVPAFIMAWKVASFVHDDKKKIPEAEAAALTDTEGNP